MQNVTGAQGWDALFLLKIKLEILLRKIPTSLNFKNDLGTVHTYPDTNSRIHPYIQLPQLKNILLNFGRESFFGIAVIQFLENNFWGISG